MITVFKLVGASLYHKIKLCRVCFATNVKLVRLPKYTSVTYFGSGINER